MPRSKKTAVSKVTKIDSMKQVSLMAFVKSTTSSFDSNPPVQNTLATNKRLETGSTTIIPETPEVKMGTSRIFRSSTGDLIQAPPPSALSATSTSHSYHKPRRSSFVTQRHAHALEKRALEGRVDLTSRMGDYDGLNYAPINQNPAPSIPNTFASERARRMVRLAVGKNPPAKPQAPVKRPIVLEEESVIEDSVILEDVKSPPPQPRTVKLRRTITLDSPEERHLNNVLNEINKEQESPEKINSKKELKYDEKFGEGLILGDSFVNALDDDWSREFEENLNLETNGSGKIQEKVQRLWYRCRITDISSKGHSVTVSAVHLDTEEPITIGLSGTWIDTPVQLGDIIHLVPSLTDLQSSDSPPSVFHLSDEDYIQSEGTLSPLISTPRLFVLQPEVLISATTVASAAAGGCSRRAVLQHLWAENEVVETIATESSAAATASSASGTPKPAVNVMLVGSVVHEVFQETVKRRMLGKPTPTEEVLFNCIIKPSIVFQLYGLGDSTEEFCSALEVFLPKIDQLVKEHCHLNSTTAPSNMPTIKEILDIEENIWCTKIGVKGKIDMTVMCQNGKGSDYSVIPLELKTGKPSFSFEHQGQVLLYLLMLSDRHSDRLQGVAKQGWLVYLRQPSQYQTGQSGLIKPQASSFRGLIQTRNRLAASLKRLLSLDGLTYEVRKGDAKWTPQLPSPLDRERVCSWCPYLLTCGLFRGESTPPPNDTQLHRMLNDCIKHIKTDHRTFLLHWTRLQLLEYANSNRVDKVLTQIAESTNEQGSGGIRGLIVENKTKSVDDREFTISLRKWNGGPITAQGLSLGDFLIVSSDDGRHVGLCLATLSTISPSSRSLTINTDRPLPLWVIRFRLDRYFSDKVAQINLSNLVELMKNSRICARLRKLLIDQNCPRFTHNLKKSTLLDIRRFLRPLNIHQRRAVLSVLMSKDYTLIEGFPGSGKTETLAALLRCLAVLGKQTLLISHTHSAVDNVLLRLTTDSNVKFIRLGSPDKVHNLLRSHNLETILSREISSNLSRSNPSQTAALCSRLVKYVDQVMAQATLIGCTALGAAGHEALARRKFDVVVVDEATQLLLPTALGGLFKLEPDSSQFVLVGDDKQLPPLVQSNVARDGGFGTSLFTHLYRIVQYHENTQVPDRADSLGSCLVQLRAQYRMNSRILRLANTLFYNDAMQCASDEVANRTLKLKQSVGETTNWLNQVLSPKMEDSVIFLDTQSICKRLGGNSNPVEINVAHKLVSAFIKGGVSIHDIGVIAPYRVQVDALRERLRGNKRIETDLIHSSTEVEVNTADQFQGRDKSLIIVSFVDCLRHNGRQSDTGTDKKRSCSLFNDGPRLNVALTRAKHKLILIGCAGEHSKPGEGKLNKDGSVLEQMLTVLQEMSVIVPVLSL